MSNLYIKAGSPTEWVRPGGWVSIPSITSSDTKFYGVYAVYENKKNNVYIAVGAGTSPNVTINWGDGSSNTNVTSLITVSKTYNYSSLTSPILQDAFGDNYKTVLVTITNNSGTVTRFNLGSTSSIGTYNWLDIIVSWPGASIQFLKSHPLLQRFIQLSGSWSGVNVNSFVTYLSNCKVLQLPVNLGTPTQAASVFSFSGDFEMGDITIGGSISVQSIFANSLIRKVGNVNFSSATTVATLFNSCYNLIEVGNVNISSATTTTNTFTGCHKLIKVGEINNTASTNIQAMFSGCSYIKQISFTNLSNVSSATTSLFNACYSLQSLRVPGLKVTFTLIDTAMERPALVQVFNDLGTPATTQIVTVTRTPGSADLTAADILIATGKNWTVTL